MSILNSAGRARGRKRPRSRDACLACRHARSAGRAVGGALDLEHVLGGIARVQVEGRGVPAAATQRRLTRGARRLSAASSVSPVEADGNVPWLACENVDGGAHIASSRRAAAATPRSTAWPPYAPSMS